MAPPRLARWVFSRLVSDPAAAGELDELYEQRLRSAGSLNTCAWFWWQIPSFAARLAWCSVQESVAQLRRGPRSLSTTLSRAPAEWLQDTRFALRGFRRSPTFTVIAVCTLALGIGANAAIFNIVHSVVLRPLEHGGDGRVVRVWPEHRFTRENVLGFSGSVRSVESFSGFVSVPATLSDADGFATTEILATLGVTPGHFEAFELEPHLGRHFDSSDSQPGAEPVAVVSHSLWKRLGSDETIIGRHLAIRGFGATGRTVVGVAAPGFRPLTGRVDCWLPITMDPDSDEFSHLANLGAIARLAPGRTTDDAASELRLLATNMSPPVRYQDRLDRYTVVALRDAVVGRVKPMLVALLAAVAVVLVLCCTNVTNLLLVRLARRHQEFRLRLALGASRTRVCRQLLTENICLAMLAATVGILAAAFCTSALVAILPAEIPRTEQIAASGLTSLSHWIVSAVIGVALLVSVPLILRVWREGAPGTRHEGLRSRSQKLDWHRAIIVVEVGLSFALVVAAALLLKSFTQLQRVDTGLVVERVLSMQLTLPESRNWNEPAKRAYVRRLHGKLKHIPGVVDVGAMSALPMTPRFVGVSYSATGAPIAPGQRPPSSGYRVVTPDTMRALGIPVLRGRDLSWSDQDGSEAVGLVNQRMADILFPTMNPIGRHVHFDDGSVWFKIVGVVADFRQQRLDAETREEVYVPFEQDPWPNAIHLVFRTASEPYELVDSLRHSISSVDPDVPISNIHTMQEVVATSMNSPRLRTLLFGLFAGVAVLLSAIGVYGVIAYSVAQRTHELGIRLAMGASRQEILWQAIARAGAPLVAGLFLGFGVVQVSSKALRSFLYGVEPNDLGVQALVAALLLVVALLASYLPARRASRIDPATSLKAQSL